MSTAVMSTARFSTPARISATRSEVTPRLDSARPSHLRITRRGYALLTLVVAAPLVIAAVGFAVNGGGAAAGADASSVVFEHVTVQPGESLWQLAGEIAPSSDPRDVVSDIVQLNQLNSAEVQPGQSLAVPLKYSH
ncbi:LysM peptidoglycan-binding domain-containing protein [Lacisediminihabitans sp. FW035]